MTHRSEAITWTIDDQPVLITGGTSGIGRATAAQLARSGARVTITSRAIANAEAVAAELSAEAGNEVAGAELDLSSLQAVRAFAAGFEGRHDRLGVLINNAGTMSGRRRTTVDGFEWTLAVNHLGPFLLTNLLTPMLVDSAPSRVVNVSSENHRGAKRGLDFDDLQMATGYSASKAYAASKLANILFTVELDRRLGPSGVVARALHPGVVRTNFGKGPGGPTWMKLAMTVLSPVLASPERGASTSVLLASAQPDELDAGIYWASGKPKRPSDSALDREAAHRLWELSARLVGLDVHR